MEAMMNILENLQVDNGMDFNAPLEVCEVCNDTLEMDIEFFGKLRRVRKICSCIKKAREEKEREEKNKEKQIFLNRIFKNSLMEEKYKEATFQNWKQGVGDKKLYNICSKYAQNFKVAKEKNLGLFIHGKPGNGKTYATCCIANHLLSKGIPTVCVSINKILERIKETYNSYGKEGEDQVIRSFSNADFLIIDDLGTELKSEWAISRIYKIIDARYRNSLPTIITTNFPMNEINERYDDRVCDRLREMCTPVECTGRSIREAVSRRKYEELLFMVDGRG